MQSMHPARLRAPCAINVEVPPSANRAMRFGGQGGALPTAMSRSHLLFAMHACESCWVAHEVLKGKKCVHYSTHVTTG
jgi:hypothetical protein